MSTRLHDNGHLPPVHAIRSARSARRAHDALPGRLAGSGAHRRSRPALPLAIAALAAVPAALALEGEARAGGSAAPDFGRPGQVVLPELVGVRTGLPQYFGSSLAGFDGAATIANVGWGGALGYNKSSTTTTWGAGTDTEVSGTATSESFWLAPAVDVFVARRVSIGLAAGVLFAQSRFDGGLAGPSAYEIDSLSVAAAPRVGYVVPLGEGLSFWPRLGVALSASEQSGAVGPDNRPVTWTGRSIAGGLDLALVYHPHRRLMFQVAPQIGVGHSSGDGPVATSGTWVRVGGEATAGLVF